jgi:hypothetical protein
VTVPAMLPVISCAQAALAQTKVKINKNDVVFFTI